MSSELPKSAFQSILDCIDMINGFWNIPTEKNWQILSTYQNKPM